MGSQGWVPADTVRAQSLWGPCPGARVRATPDPATSRTGPDSPSRRERDPARGPARMNAPLRINQDQSGCHILVLGKDPAPHTTESSMMMSKHNRERRYGDFDRKRNILHNLVRIVPVPACPGASTDPTRFAHALQAHLTSTWTPESGYTTSYLVLENDQIARVSTNPSTCTASRITTTLSTS